MDSFFLGSCFNICGHFDILRESADGDKKKFIERHQKLLGLIEDLNRLFRPVIFTQFFISSVALCFLGFQLVMVNTFINWATAVFHGLAIIIQLFIYDYGGQLILDKTSAVADHFYQSDKDFVIIIRRAQNASIVKVGFYRATLPEFCDILNTAGSLITMLISFSD